MRESGLQANAHIVGSDAFKEFFRKVRSTGESPSAADVINVARLFDDDLTLRTTVGERGPAVCDNEDLRLDVPVEHGVVVASGDRVAHLREHGCDEAEAST